MSKYKLLAFDLDGTLLDSNKQVLPASIEAIHKAAEAGKEIILCTGRAVSEVTDYTKVLPDVRYVICLSGALIMDLKENRKIYSNAIPVDVIRDVIRIALQEDHFIQFLSVDTYMDKDKGRRVKDYTIGQYQELFNQVAVMVDDIPAWFEANPQPMEKINVCSRDFETRDRTLAKLQKLPVEICLSEGTMTEMSPPNVNKAEAMRILGEQLGITMDEMIMVGDGNNDVEAMMASGFSIGMGNAFPRVLEICDAVVSDNDHDGCKEAIENYLLA